MTGFENDGFSWRVLTLSARSFFGRLAGLIQTRNGRIAISAGLIALILIKLDISETLDALLSARWDYLAAALATFAASLVLGNVQWVKLLKLQGIVLPFRRTLSFYFVGAFFNNIMPANIGGDVVRVHDVYRESRMPHQAIAATVTDRFFGMVALGLLAMPAGLYVALRYEALGLERGFGLWSLAIVVGFMIILALSCLLIFSRRLARVVERVVRPLLIRGTRDRFKRVYESFYSYRANMPSLPVVLAVAIVVQALRVLVHFEVSEAMGLNIPLIYFFLFVPVIAIFIALPISIGGLGMREWLMIAFFCRAVPGLTDEQAVAVGLLAYVVGVVVSLAGGVIYLGRGLTPGQIEKEFSDGRLSDAG